MIWIGISFFITGIYVYYIGSLYIVWNRLPVFDSSCKQVNVYVSVIIPFRNEEDKLRDVLDDLLIQNYDKKNFEIILVNDHSEDKSLEVAGRYATRLPNMKILELTDKSYGKKQALNRAIHVSFGELIVTLDADCRVDANWLITIAEYYQLHPCRLIVLPLLFHVETGWFQQMQSLEMASLVASGAGAISMGRPILCNGANLAFTRESYLAVYDKMPADVPSGDDVFLLLAIKKQWPGSIAFLKSIDATAYTLAVPSLQQFIEQRNRWTSKSRFYNDFDILAVAVLVFLINLLLLCFLGASLVFPKFLLLGFIVFVGKSIVDVIFLQSFVSFFNKKKLLKYFVFAQMLYPFYIVFVALTGNLRKVRWKQRIFK
jgi:cellulose synthase/poly-beta-1,6-N-acetylglucosamine synthase-like glycosyltransferase